MKNLVEKPKKEYWKEQITKFHQSGQSRREYCLSEKIKYRAFSYWLKKTKHTQDEKLVKIPRQNQQQKNVRHPFVEIIITEKISIRITQNFDGELLRNVITELGMQL